MDETRAYSILQNYQRLCKKTYSVSTYEIQALKLSIRNKVQLCKTLHINVQRYSCIYNFLYRSKCFEYTTLNNSPNSTSCHGAC